jgi:hypothetical protein
MTDILERRACRDIKTYIGKLAPELVYSSGTPAFAEIQAKLQEVNGVLALAQSLADIDLDQLIEKVLIRQEGADPNQLPALQKQLDLIFEIKQYTGKPTAAPTVSVQVDYESDYDSDDSC